jgi:response regulator of citrate/malate metabolism
MSEELQSSDHDKKTLRSEYPSGWLVLTKNESVPYIVDALLDAPPHREFNQTELAEHAGVSRQSVSRYLDLLEDIGIVEPVGETSRKRYRFNPESSVSEALIRLDGAMNAAGAELEPGS